MKGGLFFAIVFTGALVAGCSQKTVPVTTDTNTTNSKDSTTTETNTLVSDSSYVERMIKKLMAGSQVGLTLSPGQYDSLVKAMKQLPPAVRTIYLTDPKLETKLSFYIDSLGRLAMKCETMDRYYYEKDTESKKTIYALTQKLTEVQEEKNKLEKQVRQVKPGIWQDIKVFFRTTSGIITIAGILLALGFFTGLLKRK